MLDSTKKKKKKKKTPTSKGKGEAPARQYEGHNHVYNQTSYVSETLGGPNKPCMNQDPETPQRLSQNCV